MSVDVAEHASRLLRRPRVGALTVPYVVDDTRVPIDFKVLDMDHVARCAAYDRCGICGGRIRGRFAFIGPETGVGQEDGRRCFADAWMHDDCARLALRQCPFLAQQRDWRDPGARTDVVLEPYRQMLLWSARRGHAHRDVAGRWHFEAIGELRREAVA